MTESREIRIRYTKLGPLRFIGHLDTTRLLTRALARSTMPVLYSQGFSPHMKLSFGPPLPLGFTSEMELVEVQVDGAEATGKETEWAGEMRSYLPKGMEIRSLDYIGDESARLSKAVDRVEYELSLPEQFSLSSDELARFLQKEVIEIEKVTKSGRKRVNIRPAVETFNAVDSDPMGDRMSLYSLVTVVGSGFPASPGLILNAFLGKPWETVPGIRVHRKRLYSSIGLL